jgi:enediyne polyketide synthase
MATNQVKLKILGLLKTDDLVESRLWLDRVSGQKESVLDLIFDWYKVLPDQSLVKVAVSEQRVSWIEITGHGEGKVEAFPESIREFVDFMKPRKISQVNQNPSESMINFTMGEKLFEFNSKRPLLFQHLITTTFEESNLVGNIYFSNYSKWLGKTRDLYFFQILPKYFTESTTGQEFFCTNCEIYHLAEAMPFDRIKVFMYLSKVYENGMDLYFEFFKESSSKPIRLAYANHSILWGSIHRELFIPNKIPSEFISQNDAGFLKK